MKNVYPGYGVNVEVTHCTKMLSDALKTEGLEERLRLTDISEIVLEACK